MTLQSTFAEIATLVAGEEGGWAEVVAVVVVVAKHSLVFETLSRVSYSELTYSACRHPFKNFPVLLSWWGLGRVYRLLVLLSWQERRVIKGMVIQSARVLYGLRRESAASHRERAERQRDSEERGSQRESQ